VEIRLAMRLHIGDSFAENSSFRQSYDMISGQWREDQLTKLRLVRAAKSAKFEPPLRKSNAEARSREYLTLAEVKKVRDAARSEGRNGHRDGLMVLMLFRHGLRVAEVVALTWTRSILMMERS
jgi:integrase